MDYQRKLSGLRTVYYCRSYFCRGYQKNLNEPPRSQKELESISNPISKPVKINFFIWHVSY